MNRRIVLGILLVLLLAAVTVTVGGMAYNAGVARGLADSGKLVAPEGALPMMYGAPFFYGGWGWGWGFGLARCLIPLLGFFFFFAILRVIFWRGRWGWRRGWGERGQHWKDFGPEGQGTPPMFEEWHRRAHGQPETPAPGANQ
jgi:hypothetical protein